MNKFTLTIETDDAALAERVIVAAQVDVPDNVPVHAPTVGSAPTAPQPAYNPPVQAPTVDNPLGQVDVDARGYPWDERIHASSRATNKDGTWRYRRGMERGVIDAVEAEITPFASLGGDFVTPTPTPTPTVDVPVPTPTPTVDVPVPSAPVGVTYDQVIAEMTDALTDGKLTPGDLPEFYRRCGIAQASEFVGNQAALDAAHALVTEGLAQ